MVEATAKSSLLVKYSKTAWLTPEVLDEWTVLLTPTINLMILCFIHVIQFALLWLKCAQGTAACFQSNTLSQRTRAKSDLSHLKLFKH